MNQDVFQDEKIRLRNGHIGDVPMMEPDIRTAMNQAISFRDDSDDIIAIVFDRRKIDAAHPVKVAAAQVDDRLKAKHVDPDGKAREDCATSR